MHMHMPNQDMCSFDADKITKITKNKTYRMTYDLLGVIMMRQGGICHGRHQEQAGKD